MKISSEMRSPDPANEEAATQLGDFLIQYRGIQKKPNRQETQLIKGLLLDAQQGKYTAPLQTLQLTTVLTKLKKLNEDYEQLLDHRTNEGLAATFIATKPLRSEMDQQYDFLSSQKAITSFNNIIKATMVARRQRNGLVHLKPDEEEEQENDRAGS